MPENHRGDVRAPSPCRPAGADYGTMVQARRPGRRDSHLSETATSETYRRACRHFTDETRMASERLGRIGFELGGAFAGGMKLQDPAACRGADLAADRQSTRLNSSH